MITPHYPPEFGWYGPGRDSMELALFLLESGHQVEVIACGDKLGDGETYQDGIKVTRISWHKNGNEKGLIAHSLPKTMQLTNINMAFWKAYLQSSKSTDYDVIDTCGVSAESLIPTIISDCPVFTRTHIQLPKFLEEKFKFKDDDSSKFEQQLTETLASISSQWITAQSIGKLNYSLDTESFSPDGLLTVDTGDKPCLLIHTSIKNEKYKTMVRDIVAKIKIEIPELWLAIVAHDVDSEVSEVKASEALQKAGIACDMVINHSMSRFIMPGLWRNSWCGLILDWQSVGPYALLEPLSCARPIVAETAFADTSFIEKPELLNQNKEFSPDSVAEKLVSLLRDEHLRKSQGAAAREYILASHCRKANGEKVIKAYTEEIEKYRLTHRVDRINRMEQLLDQCRTLFDGLDQWLYNFLFLRSIRFRLSHWMKKFGKGNNFR